MKAAERLFTSRRFHEITLDEVARAARVGKGTIYQYFRDKDDLFFEVATSGFEELCAAVSPSVYTDAPFAEQLAEAACAISSFFRRRRQLLQMMQSEDARMWWRTGRVRERWTARRQKLVAALSMIIRKGVNERAVRSDVRPEILAAFLLGLLRTRARDLADIPERKRPVELVVDFFCTGAAARTAKVRKG